MKEQEFIDYLRSRGLNDEAGIAQSVAGARALEEYLVAHGRSVAEVTRQDVRGYLDGLIQSGKNTLEQVLGAARYLRWAGRSDAFIYLVGVFGGQTVLPSIAQRTEELAGAASRAAVFDGLGEPPLGSDQRANPPVTARMLRRLQAQVPPETCRRILAGNHHLVPPAIYEPLRKLYLEQGIDAVLARRHETLVTELEEHVRTGQPWYEQMITPEVVEFVQANPEIQAGVRYGNKIVVQKIPYAPADYLATDDPVMKRYYLCHCTLARAGILEEGQGVDPAFCMCSAGYEKLPYDVVFGRETEAEVLESALGGSTRCRIAITIPE